MSKNMRNDFVSSNFDEVDIVLDTDRRFDEAIAAADAGEEDLVDAIVKEMQETGVIGDCTIKEEDLIEYNPESDDAIGVLDCTAEDYREYVSEEDYSEDDGDLIDAVMNDDMSEYDE